MSDEIQRPNPASFKTAGQDGSTSRIDEYLPGSEPVGYGGRKKKEPAKKWTPTPTTENSRPDDWVGSPGMQKKRSWKVKKVMSNPPPEVSSDEKETEVVEATPSSAAAPSSAVEAAPAPAPATKASEENDDASSVVEVDSESESEPIEPAEKPTPTPVSKKPSTTTSASSTTTTTIKHDSEIHRPNPESFKVAGQDGSTSRIDEYLPGSEPVGYGGRTKTAKKWTPTPTAENSRPNDWVGSPGRNNQRRSWKVKSPLSSAPKVEIDEKEEEITESKPVAAPSPAPAKTVELKKDGDDDHSSVVEVESDDEAEEKTAVKKSAEPFTNSTSSSTTTTKHDSEIYRPNPESFKVAGQDGSTSRIDEYLPGSEPVGYGGRTKTTKKWTPTPTAENSRPNDWVGSPGRNNQRRSWKVKSPAAKPVLNDSDDEAETKPTEKPTAPSPAPAPEPSKEEVKAEADSESEVEVESDEEIEQKPVEEKSKAAPAPAVSSPAPAVSHVDTEIGRPNPESFKMMNVREGETDRPEDFLGANTSSGRTKVDTKKKWTPTPTTENSRPGDWLGSPGAVKKRSWKVKGT